MPHSRSARKALRVAERQQLENRGVRSAIRTYFRKARQSVTQKADDAADLVRLAVSQLDKAATKNVIHPNQAARRKSRLMHRLAVLQADMARAAEAGAAAPAAPRRRTTRAAAGEAAAAPARTRRTAASSTSTEAAPRRRRTTAS